MIGAYAGKQTGRKRRIGTVRTLNRRRTTTVLQYR